MKKSLVVLCIVVGIAIAVVLFMFLNKSETYTVTFISENGNTNQSVEVEENDTVEKISDPTKEGYTFEGWYIGEEKFDFSKKITENVTITAKWKKILLEDELLVTFDTDGGNLIDEISVKKGSVITKPTDPTKKGYTFVEWQLDGEAYDFTTKVEKDVKLIAIWKEDVTVQVTRYTVTFDSNGGSAVSNKTVVENEKVSKPTNPTKDNYNFIEWRLNDKTYDFNTKVTKNITLKAVWKEKDKVIITFDSDGGTAVASRSIYQGNALGVLPPNPTKNGFTFDGWFNSNNKYDASSVINNSLTLKAKWVDNNEIALNNAKAAIADSYRITKGGQTISESYTGCTIVHSNPEVIAKITRTRSNTNVTLNFNITCGSKTGTESATGIIEASPYTYTATANPYLTYHTVIIKEGGTQIFKNSSLSDLSGNFLADYYNTETGYAASVNNDNVVNRPNLLMNFEDDAKTLYIVANG